MGGRGSSGKSGGRASNGGGASATISRKVPIDTPQQAKEFIKSLSTGDKFTMINDYSDMHVTKTDSKKYTVKETGVSFLKDGGYVPYNREYTLSEGTVLKRIQNAKSIRRR